MTESCPVPTPEERVYIDIQSKAEMVVWNAVNKALDDATAEAAAALRAAGSTLEPPARDYLAAVLHQKLFVSLCGGDPETLLGGDPEIAAHIVQNGQNIADHYWTGQDAQGRGVAEGEG